MPEIRSRNYDIGSIAQSRRWRFKTIASEIELDIVSQDALKKKFEETRIFLLDFEFFIGVSAVQALLYLLIL